MFLPKDVVTEENRYLVDYLNRNYEYCYLDAMPYLNETCKFDTIITGLS